MNEYKINMDIVATFEAKNQRCAIQWMELKILQFLDGMVEKDRYITVKERESGDVERLP